MPVARTRLTDGTISALKPAVDRYFVRDESVRGLAVAIHPAGQKSFVYSFDYKDAGGIRQSKRVTLGDARTMSVKEARNLAATTKANYLAREAAPQTDGPHTWTVRTGFAEYVKRREPGVRHREDLEYYLDKYLADYGYANVPLTSLRRVKVADLHDTISKNHGKVTGDIVLNALGSVYKLAFKLSEEGTMPANPVTVAVELNRPDRGEQPWVRAEDLPEFLKAVRVVPNPLWQCCYQLGLYTGIRPEKLREIERVWLRPDRIVVPRAEMKMKSGRGDFTAPLSKAARQVVARALTLGDILHPGTRYLFPGDSKGHLSGNRPKSLPVPLKAMRRTHKTLGTLAGVSKDTIELLQDRAEGGVGDLYLEREGIFSMLLEAQEKIAMVIAKSGGGVDLTSPKLV